ncbi:uncharacterized protein LOC107215844 [Parus major]|uniref:uncharacterized protein LOC107215844 n=1 Tax=Parus major TaxID=9157 RepID=UPI001443ABCE|nr:uncharacterized protein LOC107215844 [Parus major]
MPLLSLQARPLPHAPCSSFPMPPHFPLFVWVCASVCHGGETAPPRRALLPPDTLNFTLRPPAAAAEPPTARPCGLSLPKDLFLPWPLRPQPVTRSLGCKTESAADSRVSHRRLRGGFVAPTSEIRVKGRPYWPGELSLIREAGWGGSKVCSRARGGVRCAPRRRAQAERSAPALAVQRRAACAPIGCRPALLRPSQLASAVGREGQDLFPYEGGSRARAALAGVVWERGEEGAGIALCLCPAGGAGRSQPDGPGISCVWLLGQFFPHHSHYSQPLPCLFRRTCKRLSLLLLPWHRTTRRRKKLAGMYRLSRRKMAFFLPERRAEEAQEKVAQQYFSWKEDVCCEPDLLMSISFQGRAKQWSRVLKHQQDQSWSSGDCKEQQSFSLLQNQLQRGRETLLSSKYSATFLGSGFP